jgi:hypothetical protein
MLANFLRDSTLAARPTQKSYAKVDSKRVEEWEVLLEAPNKMIHLLKLEVECWPS